MKSFGLLALSLAATTAIASPVEKRQLGAGGYAAPAGASPSTRTGTSTTSAAAGVATGGNAPNGLVDLHLSAVTAPLTGSTPGSGAADDPDVLVDIGANVLVDTAARVNVALGDVLGGDAAPVTGPAGTSTGAGPASPGGPVVTVTVGASIAGLPIPAPTEIPSLPLAIPTGTDGLGLPITAVNGVPVPLPSSAGLPPHAVGVPGASGIPITVPTSIPDASSNAQIIGDIIIGLKQIPGLGGLVACPPDQLDPEDAKTIIGQLLSDKNPVVDLKVALGPILDHLTQTTAPTTGSDGNSAPADISPGDLSDVVLDIIIATDALLSAINNTPGCPCTPGSDVPGLLDAILNVLPTLVTLGDHDSAGLAPAINDLVHSILSALNHIFSETNQGNCPAVSQGLIQGILDAILGGSFPGATTGFAVSLETHLSA